MVKNGQPFVVEFGFSNPDRPRLGAEVLDLARLRRRLHASALATVHRTDFHQLFLFTSGTGTTMVDFVDHVCVAGTLLHVCPGRVLRLPRGPVEAVMVLFTPSFAPRLARVSPLLTPFGLVEWTLGDEELGTFQRAVRELRDEYRRAVGDGDPELLRHLLGGLLLRISRLPAAVGATRDDTFLRFQQEVERSFAATRHAADYAARVGYSLRTLNRVCHAVTGSSTKALIDARVALEAKRLLVHTDLPAASIGHRLGFSEPTNFTKFFARETGLTPGAFRDGEQAGQT